MAKVFTGRVRIPGDKIDEYFKLMAAAEEARRPFREYLESLNDEFAGHLAQKFSERTVRKHTGIVSMFIEFVIRQTDVENIDEITRGIANTHFRKWYKRKVWDSATENDLKVALRKFFTFLSEKKGITNEKALKGLK
jgi:site-specific recombinase XerD